MGGRPSKPTALILLEGKSHRTKAELEKRKEAEKALITGQPMKEWAATKQDPVAHSHWIRMAKLYRAIGKNDALVEATMNRYCMLLSECESVEKEDQRLHALAEKLDDRQDEMEFAEYIRLSSDINRSIAKNQTALQNKRKMLLDIEKENIMTLAAQMRSIPKQPDKNERPTGMAAFRQKRAEMS